MSLLKVIKVYLERSSLSYHVNTYGKGEALLLLHGFTGDNSTWDTFISSWKERYQVITVDIIGHGKTDCPNEIEQYSIFAVVEQLREIIEKLGLIKVNLLGYSMGGRLALAYYFKYPQTVNKLILESTSPGLRTEHERTERRIQDEKLGDSIIEYGIESFTNKWENIPLFQSQQALTDSVKQKIRNQRLANNPVGLANSLKGMGTGAQPSYWTEVPKLTNTLLITGDLDQKFVRIANEMTEINEILAHISVNNAGHAIHVEKPEIFDTIVMEFLENHQ